MTPHDSPRFRVPVMIMGAPRSGTSLLHRILRGHPGFVSTALESQPVWRPLTEPAKAEWSGERAPSHLDERNIEQIHRTLAKLALPAELWRRADTGNVVVKQQYPHLSGWLLRPGYRALVTARGLLWRRTIQSRLVDKSVHSGLWPELLETVFPDARYIHIVRDPTRTLQSMIGGWLNPERFFTWEPPEALTIPDYPFHAWNFPMPIGWHEWRGHPLAEVVAFQWASIQEGILGLERRTPTSRFLRLRLEDLNARPRGSIETIATFLELPWSEYLEGFASHVPVVNASAGNTTRAMSIDKSVDEVLPMIEATARRLGYKVTPRAA